MELLVGKTLTSFVPAMLVTVVSFAIYAGITDYLDYPMFGYAILPNFIWILILVGIAPAFAIAATGMTVIVSTRVSGTREAQQVSGLLVIPIIGLLFGQTTGIILLGVNTLLIVLGVMICTGLHHSKSRREAIQPRENSLKALSFTSGDASRSLFRSLLWAWHQREHPRRSLCR